MCLENGMGQQWRWKRKKSSGSKAPLAFGMRSTNPSNGRFVEWNWKQGKLNGNPDLSGKDQQKIFVFDWESIENQENVATAKRNQKRRGKGKRKQTSNESLA